MSLSSEGRPVGAAAAEVGGDAGDDGLASSSSSSSFRTVPRVDTATSNSPRPSRTANSRLHYILHKDSSQNLGMSSESPSSTSGLFSRHYYQQLSSSPQVYSPVSGASTPKGGMSPSIPSSPVTTTTASVKETHHINIDYDPVSGRKTLNTYEIIRELGRGQHGKVKLGRDLETGEYVAIKVVDRTGRPRLGRLNTRNTQEDKIKREIAILKKCVHPNIVRLREVLDDATSKKIYLVLEYMEKGEICWQTETGEPAMSRYQVKSTARDVLLGLEYLHYQGIIHRDIKPANLLLSADEVVKISDFGVSYASDCGADEFELAKTAGTPAFFAPELCVTSTDTPRPAITYKIDIWALGVTLFCLLYGCVPFIADSEFELFKVIVNQPLIFPDEVPPAQRDHHMSPADTIKQLSMFYYPRNSAEDEQQQQQQPTAVSERPKDSLEPLTPRELDADLELAKDLLRKLLEKDPEKRISLEEIKHHPWICDGLESQTLDKFLTNPAEVDERIEVTGEEVRAAVQGMTGKIKRGLTKFGSTALQFAGLRRRKSSTSSSNASSHWGGSRPGSRSTSREPPQPIPTTNTATATTRHHGGASASEHSSPVPTLTRPTLNTAPSRPLSGGLGSLDVDRRRSSAASSLSSVGGPNSASSSYTAPPTTTPATQRRTMTASTSNFNLNALLEGTIDEPSRGAPPPPPPSRPLQLNPGPPQHHTPTTRQVPPAPIPPLAYSISPVASADSSSSSSSSSSYEKEGSDDEDNGELTLVLGPSSRSGLSVSPNQPPIASPKPPRTPQPSASQNGLRIFKQRPASTTINNDHDDDDNDDDHANERSSRTNRSESSRLRSRSITVGVLQRPPPKFDL
ncbi:hypothetical protein TRICI_005867 [Trichomonascus ciferrii]|uniref:non-specific serine/threonine protein kinase n=1 Tax=Trichomonascus ciferrii TaxID=44093 RepID=A0A642UNW1_9ASCO|nr:hypothetical protein TRICI_005867 [Trichomonascus ciferrii]